MGPPETASQILDGDVRRAAARPEPVGALVSHGTVHDLARTLVDLSSRGALLQCTPAPAVFEEASGRINYPNSALHATWGMGIVKLDLLSEDFRQFYKSEGKRGVDCGNGTCCGAGLETTGHFNTHFIYDADGCKPMFSATSVCDCCGHKIDHASRTACSKAPIPVLEEIRTVFEPTAVVDGSKPVLGSAALLLMSALMRTGAGAAQVADSLNQAERDAITRRSVRHAYHASQWFKQVSATANDAVWNSLPLEGRRKIYKNRVAFQRCKGHEDKVPPIYGFLLNGAPDVTGAFVINAFLAWSEARRGPILRQMNAAVSKEILTADHTKTSGLEYGANWMFNVCSEDSTPLGHFLTESTSFDEVAPHLAILGRRPGMAPKMLVLDDWMISREVYVEQLERLEAGLDWNYEPCVFWKWKTCFNTLQWPATDRFHIAANNKKDIPYQNWPVVYYLFTVLARECLGSFDAVAEKALDNMPLSGAIGIKEFALCGVNRSCKEGVGISTTNLDDWKRSGAYWNVFGTGKGAAVLRQLPDRYNAIEEKCDAWEREVVSTLFWGDESPKTFSSDGRELARGAEGRTICSSISWFRHLASKFKRRAILAGAAVGPRFKVETHTAEPNKLKFGLQVWKSRVHTCGVESLNGRQQGNVAASGNLDLLTALGYCSASHNMRVLLDGRQPPSKRVKTDSWAQGGMRLNALSVDVLPSNRAAVPLLATEGVELAPLFRNHPGSFMRVGSNAGGGVTVDQIDNGITVTPAPRVLATASTASVALTSKFQAVSKQKPKKQLTAAEVQAKKDRAKAAVAWSRTLSALAPPCTCEMSTKTDTGRRGHNEACSRQIFVQTHSAARPIVGVVDDTDAQAGMKAATATLGDTVRYLPGVSGKDGYIIFAETVAPGKVDVPTARRKKEWVEVGNRCLDCASGVVRSFGKFKTGTAMPVVRQQWAANIARARQPPIIACKCP
jgi:hypothetical protein